MNSVDTSLETAREAVDEANAAIGAAISSGTLPGGLEPLLYDVQRELLVLAEAVASGRTGAGPRNDLLIRARDEYPHEVPPHAAVLGGGNAGAGLLKLARAVTRRARRAVAVVSVSAEHGDYLELLEDVLLAVALRSEQLEREQVPLGLCFQAGTIPTWSDH